MVGGEGVKGNQVRSRGAKTLPERPQRGHWNYYYKNKNKKSIKIERTTAYKLSSIGRGYYRYREKSRQ
jgi:hypothetical protein